MATLGRWQIVAIILYGARPVQAVTPVNRPMSIAQLRREGFTTRQIRGLKALRESYPIREHVTSSRDMHRLELLRWMRRNGRLTEEM